ncbi:predicted protein, partial [Postia placenta Mad-698-R]
YQMTYEISSAVEYADLAFIDLSKMDTPEGRAELTAEVRNALNVQGFFYVINHGLTQAEASRMFDIGDVPFSQVSEEEKLAYQGNVKETGSYLGYKLRQYWVDADVADQIEHYNSRPNTPSRERLHPKAVRPFLPELSKFARFNHFNVLHPLLRLMAAGMELPEDTFTNIFGYLAEGETWRESSLSRGHTGDETSHIAGVHLSLTATVDYVGLTLLWSQPISALQILCHDGQWRWVKHVENAIVVNAGEAMEFLSGGYYKGTIHRVVQPPEDQRGYSRLGLIYFTLPDDDVKLVPFSKSPVLQREGIKRRFEDAEAPTMREW